MYQVHDLNDMMVFLAVVEAGSFTLAAERLGIPKANVSRKTSRLESQLNICLIERSTRSQNLTEAGRHYLYRCKRIQSEIEMAESEISELLSSPKGALRVGASVAIGQQVLKPELSAFLSQYSDIEMQLSLLNRRVDLIEEGYDVVIRVGKLDDSQLIGKYLGTVKRKIYLNSAWFNELTKNNKSLTKPENLAGIPWLAMEATLQQHQLQLVNGKKRANVAITPKLVVQDFSILYQMAVDGLGFAAIPEYMCRQAVKENRLVEILPGWGLEDVDIYALYPAHKSQVPKLKVFLDFIQKLFAERLNKR